VAAVSAIKRMGGRQAVDVLVKALGTTTHGRVKDDIGDALVWLTGRDFGIDDIGWSDWWNANRGSH